MNEKIEIAFMSEKTKKSFEELAKGKFSEKQLYENLNKTFNKLKKKPESGIKIQKKLWPKKYLSEYNVTNLWKIDLPNGWRLIYTLKGTDLIILTVILDWFNHKKYEKKFKY